MIANEMKSSFRFIRKNLLHFLINVFGISLGIASCLFIYLFVSKELNANATHENKELIYRIDTKIIADNLEENTAVSPAYLGELVDENLASVRKVARVLDFHKKNTIVFEQEEYTFRDVIRAEETLFDIFTINPVAGTLAGAVDKNNTAVISVSLSSLIFKSPQAAVGKTIKVNKVNYEVAAVVEDQNDNGELYFDAILSLSSSELDQEYWSSIFVLLEEEKDRVVFQKQLNNLVDEHIAGEYAEAGIKITCEAIALEDLHFTQPKLFDSKNKGSRQLNYSLAILAIFILLIAGFNYSNIFIGQFFIRQKERSVRKTLGATNNSIVLQYIFESLTTIALGILLSILILIWFLPEFNLITNKTFTLQMIFNGEGLLVLGVVSIVVFCISSIGLFLLSLKAFSAAKLSFMNNRWVRRASIAVQLTIAAIMIISALIINDQMRFLNIYNLGYEKSNTTIISIPQSEYYQSRIELLKNNFGSASIVRGVSVCSNNSLIGQDNDIDVYYASSGGEDKKYTLNNITVDEDFLEILDIQLVQGNGFEPGDTDLVLINEKMTEKLGWSDPIGKEIQSEYGPTYVVNGVVQNFHFKSLRSSLNPLILQYSEQGSFLLVNFSNGEMQEQVSLINEVWKNTYGDTNLSYEFLNDLVNTQYTHDLKANQLISLFATISIIICGLGIFGLSFYLVQSRLPEISIRKVFGAGFKEVVYSMTRDFVVSYILAISIATPVVYLIMSHWLNDFVYRITIGIIPFVISMIIIVLILSVSLAHFTVKVAKVNPVEILRGE